MSQPPDRKPDLTTDSGLRGKAAVVTGASRGIGRAVAECLAAHGANVVLNASGSPSGRERLDDLVARLNAAHDRDEGGSAIASYGPVEDDAYAAELIGKCRETLGAVEVLVTVAGIPAGSRNSITDADKDEWQRLLDVHLTGTFNCCHYAAQHMVSQSGGSIVTTTSDSWTGEYAGTGYAAAKAGVIGLTYAMARDLQAAGVRCNAIAPGARTRLGRGPIFQARIDELHRRAILPAARRDAVLAMPGPEYVAPMYAYLGSESSAPLTGQVFRVIGNRVERYRAPEAVEVAVRPSDAEPWTLDGLAEHFVGPT